MRCTSRDSSTAIGDETLVRLTIPGTVVATPQYAAPEQLRGEAVDARTDLFAAGAVLYEMLAGKPPFAGKSAVEVFHAITYEQPAMLTGGPAAAALDRVLHQALAKRRAKRYQSADAMKASSAAFERGRILPTRCFACSGFLIPCDWPAHAAGLQLHCTGRRRRRLLAEEVPSTLEEASALSL